MSIQVSLQWIVLQLVSEQLYGLVRRTKSLTELIIMDTVKQKRGHQYIGIVTMDFLFAV